MKIVIPRNIKEQLRIALVNAGSNETGGILMGEHIGVDEFHIKEITVEPSLGTIAYFVRSLAHAVSSLHKFFQKTKYDYLHFNYLGEWHSHPSFLPKPSNKDLSTMIESINDKKIGANFLVLIVLKLGTLGSLEGSATVFYPHLPSSNCELVFSET
jgi:[CysO sulfur-carrier protein]-S-L-cysteine hydrolase